MWQVFDLTPKMRCTKVSLIRNVKMMKTNLLKACVTHSLYLSLPPLFHLPLCLPGQAHLSTASESNVAWEERGRFGALCDIVWLAGSHALNEHPMPSHLPHTRTPPPLSFPLQLRQCCSGNKRQQNRANLRRA